MKAPEKEKSILQIVHLDILEIYTEVVTIEQFQEKYKTLQDNKEELTEYLDTLRVKILKNVLAQLGSYFDSRDLKKDLIRKIYNALEQFFWIGRSFSWTFGEDMQQKEIDFITGTTQKDLDKFYADRAEKKAKAEKASANPETLEEFRLFIEQNGREKLTPEQVETLEQLKADAAIRMQKKSEERENEVQRVKIEVTLSLHKTKHSKTKADIFTVLMDERVSKEEFNELRRKAKKLGGYYSRYTDKSADPQILPGFNFDNLEDANLFLNLKNEDQSAQPRKEEKKEDSKLKAAERLEKLAASNLKKGEDSLNQDRKDNTHKRAREAASAEAKATRQIQFAKKLFLIAKGLKEGNIKYLDKLSNGMQLEQLENILHRGFSIRTEDLSYQEKQQEEPNPSEDVNFIKYPFPTYHHETIEGLLLKMEDTNGIKRDVASLKKTVKRMRAKRKDHLVIFDSEYDIKELKKIVSNIFDKWERMRILEPIQNYERIQKMGIVNIDILKTALRELYTLTGGTGQSEEEKKAQEIKQIERSFIGKKIPGFFPTPKPPIEKMLGMVKVKDTDSICEPEAGLGHIAESIREKYPQNELSCIEFNYQLAEVLEKKGFSTEHENFLKTTHKYDVIFMNPPFEKHQDIDHVNHAFSLLKPGGRLVAIMAGNKHRNGSQSIINDFMDFVDEHGYLDENETGSFKSAFNPTGVNTVMVYLEKEAAPEPKPEPKAAKSNLVGQFLMF